MQAIEIKNMAFSYGNIKMFDNFNLGISEGSFVSILGKNGSGKTTLVNILSGVLKFEGNILIFGKSLSKDIINKNIFTIYDENYDYNGKVMDVLAYELKCKKIKNIKEKIMNIALELDFADYLIMNFNDLSFEKKKLVILGLGLIQNPKILILDNLFEGVNKEFKDIILKKLKGYVKKKKMTIINVSNDVEEALYANMVVVIGEGKVLLKGSRQKVFENENFFEKNDFEPPFIVNLSYKLKFYELIDKIYLSEKKLVDDLWK